MSTRSTDWVEFGSVARNRCFEQCQYASRAIDGRHGYPNLGEGLRFRDERGRDLNLSDYHFIQIHVDDVETFVRRWEAYYGER